MDKEECEWLFRAMLCLLSQLVSSSTGEEEKKKRCNAGNHECSTHHDDCNGRDRERSGGLIECDTQHSTVCRGGGRDES